VNQVHPTEARYTLKKAEEKSIPVGRNFVAETGSPNEQVSGIVFWGDWKSWRFVDAFREFPRVPGQSGFL